MVFLDTKTPSKVSTKASSIKKVFDKMVKMVEDSDKTSMAAVSGARGPEVIAMIAIWGIYAKTNMNVVMPTPSVMVGPSLDRSGFHRERWDMKYAIPYVYVSKVAFAFVQKLLLGSLFCMRERCFSFLISSFFLAQCQIQCSSSDYCGEKKRKRELLTLTGYR